MPLQYCKHIRAQQQPKCPDSGGQIFRHLGFALPSWEICCIRRDIQPVPKKCKAITAEIAGANVANELRPPKATAARPMSSTGSRGSQTR